MSVNPQAGLVFTHKYKMDFIEGLVLGWIRLLIGSVKGVILGVILANLEKTPKEAKQEDFRPDLRFKVGNSLLALHCSSSSWKNCYAIMVWWPRVQTSAKETLEHVRVLILKRVLDTMRITQVMVMEALRIEPFQLSDGSGDAFHLRCKERWRLSIKQTFQERFCVNSIFEVGQDRMVV